MANVRKKKLPPHLVADGAYHRCSVCKEPFFPDAQPSAMESFARHVLAYHQPGQKSDDDIQAAARIVREATEK